MPGNIEEPPPSAHTLEIAVIQPAGTWLVELQDESGARRVGLSKEKLVVGTSTTADLMVHDVTVSSCIELAYGVPQPIVKGPSSIKDVHYDIIAKAAPDTTKEQMHLMLQTLLTDRFHLAFHREQKELRAYTLTIMPNGAKTGIKIQPAPPGGQMSHENTATSFIAHSITMQEFIDYLAEPLGVPLTDETHLTARYDFVLDFKPYADLENNPTPPDPISFVNAALKDELGLELIKHQDQVNLLVVDHIDPPTSN